MKRWTKILPVFVVEWLAKRWLERWRLGSGETIVVAYDDVYFVVEKR